MRSALLTVLAVALGVPATASAAPVVTVPGELTVAETAGEARIAVTLSEAPEQPFDVRWRTGPPVRLADAPSAVRGRDYVEVGGTLHFAPGETRRELAITILDDAVDDPSGYLDIAFGEEDPFGGPRTLLKILDDEPTPPASVADVRVSERAGEAVVAVTRPAVSLIGDAMYDWRVRGVPRSGGRVGFGTADTAAELRVPIADDIRPEPDERLEVVLSPAAELPSPWGFFPGPVADGLATVTVVDDDRRRIVVSATPLRGRVRLGGRRIGAATEIPRGGRVDARRGAVRIAVDVRGRRTREATIAGGAVRLRDARTLALASRSLRVVSARALRVAGRTVTVRAATPDARWTMTETPRGTRVRVLRGAVRAGGARVRAGRMR